MPDMLDRRKNMASHAPAGPFILNVTFETREDGGLRAYCDKVPGFVLSHKDAVLVMADVVPALQIILSAMYGQEMTVAPAQEMSQDHTAMMPAHLCGAQQYVGVSAH
jgi:hypothetical protein